MSNIPPEIEAQIPALEKRWSRSASTKGGGHRSSVPLREFLEILYETKSAYAAAKVLGITPAAAGNRRASIEQAIGYKLPTGRPECWKQPTHMQTQHMVIENGTMLIISDTHFWPGEVSTAWAAFVGLGAGLKPDYVLINGDGIDGAATSRFPKYGWENRPKLVDELNEFRDKLLEIKGCTKNAKHLYAPGNHDVGRLDRYIAQHAPELEGMPGTTFEEFTPGWHTAGRFVVNDHRKVKCPPVIPTILKHTFKRTGIHATYNAVKDEGCHIVHGHLHRHKTVDYIDYTGTKYGVDCGVGAMVDGPQFGYMSLNTTGWQSGGVMLTWENFKMQPPELFTVTDEDAGKFRFRGTTYTVSWD